MTNKYTYTCKVKIRTLTDVTTLKNGRNAEKIEFARMFIY